MKKYSDERISYLKEQKRKKFLVHFLRVALLVLLFGVWELVSDLQIVNPFIVSSPSRIFKTLVSLIGEGNLLYHVGITLSETVLGFIIAVLLGYGVAVLLWWSDTAHRVLEPYIVVLNSLPKIALGPLVIVWCGTGSRAIVTITVLVGVIISVMNMLRAFMDTDKGKLLLMRSMGASKWQILVKLVVPSALPAFIAMLKINVGMAWIGSILGEYMVSKAGLGYLIVYGGQVFRLDMVMTAVFVLCVLAGGMYFLVSLLEKTAVKTNGGEQ